MSTFKNRRIYFQNIAHNNALIADGQPDEADGHIRKSFFRINGELEISAAVLERADFPCVVQLDQVVYPSQPGHYVYRKTVINTLLFLARFDGNNGLANVMEDATDLAYDAACQFLSVLVYDFEERDPCSGLFHFELNQSQMELVGPVLDNLIGWKVTFQYMERGNEFKYNGEPLVGCVNQTEIIYFTDETAVFVNWTAERLEEFGLYPQIQVWYYNQDGNPEIAWPSITTDVPAPDQTVFVVYNGEPRSGFIVLK